MIALSLWKGEVEVVPPAPTMRSIIAEVSKRHGVAVDELLGWSRVRHISHARQEAMWEIRRQTEKSLTAIGVPFGNRHHTSILHDIRAHEKRLADAA